MSRMASSMRQGMCVSRQLSARLHNLPLLDCRRSLHLSAALCRIPHFHRKRYRRTLVPPYHQVRYADEDLSSIQEPPLPLDGSLQTTRKTESEERWEAMVKQRSLYGKLTELNETEPNMWYRKMALPLQHPCCLPLAQALCHANIDYWLTPTKPVSKSNSAIDGAAAGVKSDPAGEAAGAADVVPASSSVIVPSATGRLTNQQREHLLSCVVTAVRAVEAQHRWPEQPGPLASVRLQQRRICAVMEALVLGCARVGALTEPEDLQPDDSPFVQMFARYSGLHPSASKRLLLPDLASMRAGRFLIRAPLAWQLRSRTPLRPLASSMSSRSPPPHWPYNPDVLGLTPEQDYWCFDETNKYWQHYYGDRVLRAVPGHVTDDYRLPGDPCEFALLLAVNGDDTGSKQWDQPPPIDFQRPEFWPALTCDALLRLYASTAAQAFNRGFNWVTDLRLNDRPFVTQSATFVGDRLKLSAFQLGTVAGGGDYQLDSSPRDASSVRVINQLWTQPEPVLLWQRSASTGRIVDANPEQLLRLADLVCAPRCSRQEAAQSRPFLDGEAPCSRTRWIGQSVGEDQDEPIYRPVQPLRRDYRPKPRSPNHLYLLDPVQPHSLYKQLAQHPRFPKLAGQFESRVNNWRLQREYIKRGRRKVVRKPLLVTENFP